MYYVKDIIQSLGQVGYLLVIQVNINQAEFFPSAFISHMSIHLYRQKYRRQELPNGTVVFMCMEYPQMDDDLIIVNTRNITNNNYGSILNWTCFIPLLNNLSFGTQCNFLKIYINDGMNFREQNNENE